MRRNPPIGVGCLVVLVGPPGAGKSTWAARYGRGAVHVSQDGLIDAITPHGFEHDYRPVYRAAEDAMARTALAAGHTVIIDRTNRTREHRRRWLAIAAEAECPAVAVEMTASESICRERNRKRDADRRVSEERMDRMIAAHQAVRASEGFTAVFTDDRTLEEILAHIAARTEEWANEYCGQAG